MSRFVSAGELEKQTKPDDDWLKAQQEIEEDRKRKQEVGKQEGGKSLYEVLQANKAAKQEAFEEKIRLSNQIAALQEDDVEYLDSVLESERVKEAAVRKETSEQLALFRKQQEEAEREALAKSGSPVEEQETWTVSHKKRKKSFGKGSLLGVKVRKFESPLEHQAANTSGISKATSSEATRSTEIYGGKRVQEAATSEAPPNDHHASPAATLIPRQPSATSRGTSTVSLVISGVTSTPVSSTKATPTTSPPALGLGLDGYSSEED